MGSALDTFRAQQEAAEQTHARLSEIAALLGRVHGELDLLARDENLRAVLQQERTWLESAQRTVSEVRAWREHERLRFWPGIVKRWAIALVFALASAAVAGAGYGWVTEPYAAELETLRSRTEFADFVEHRIITMTAAERRQFDALMRWDTSFDARRSDEIAVAQPIAPPSGDHSHLS